MTNSVEGRGRRHPRVSFSLVTALLVAFFVLPAGPAGAETASAASLVSRLTVESESGSATYVRSAFQHWIDADSDCQDARAEVLQQETRAPVEFTTSSRCTVRSGSWLSPYDGVTWTLASDVDIDHMIPLKEAWESGARSWTPSRRRDFANDLAYGATLVAVTDNVNQSKGDRDPSQWLPPLTSSRCLYAIQWAQVKIRWSLSVDVAERSALSSILSGECGKRSVPVPAVVK